MIRHGLNAYVLTCRETKSDYLYMMDDRVQKALRMVNMSISDNLLKKWLDFVITNLEWNKKERREFERRENSDESKLDVPFIMPHEFIFLMTKMLSGGISGCFLVERELGRCGYVLHLISTLLFMTWQWCDMLYLVVMFVSRACS